MRVTWITDTHLDQVSEAARFEFYENIKKEESDRVILTGDISDGNQVVFHLQEMAAIIKKNIYFVLGNHDYYHGSIATVRKTMKELTQKHQYLFWLPESEVISLTPQQLLIGQDCWADAGYGNFEESDLNLLDSKYIDEFIAARRKSRSHLKEFMQVIAGKDIQQLSQKMLQAIVVRPKIIRILLHVPPFPETCYFQDKPSDEYALPFFASKVTGDFLLQTAKKNPEINFIAYCGHSHCRRNVQISDNLQVLVGDAKTGFPAIEATF